MKNQNIITFCLAFILFACESDSENNMSVDPGVGSSGKGGSLAQFAFVGDKLYVVTNDELISFQTYHSNPMEEIDRRDLWRGVETIFPKDSLLFLGTQTGMYIYEIDQAGVPEYASFTSHFFGCDPVVADDEFAYVTLNDQFGNCGRGVNQLDIYDIENINSPQLVQSIPMTAPRGLGIDDGILFVCDNGVKVFDISNPRATLSLIAALPIQDAIDVIPDNGHLYVIGNDALYQYRYENLNLTELSRINY